MTTLNLVVTCAKRKKVSVHESLKLGSIPAGDTTTGRVTQWLKLLRKSKAPRHRAVDLYGGDHWAAVRSLLTGSLFDTVELKIWICSAGYGLITPESEICAYSATFASGQEDSVTQSLSATVDAPADWWTALSQWERPSPGSPRSIAQITRRDPDVPVLVAVSEPYLRAIRKDLTAARANLVDPQQLSILCTGIRQLSDLQEHLLPGDARLQNVAGGTRASLNVRLARKLIEEHSGDFSFGAFSGQIQKWVKIQKPIVGVKREPMSDEEVKSYVRKELQKAPTARPSPLLRQLRDSGRACEHSRFSRLYYEVKGSKSAS